jgi:hypothetical protein
MKAGIETTILMHIAIPKDAKQHALEQAITEEIALYSACATRDPTILQSHYADDHKGIALHLGPTVSPFSQVFKVNHSDH